MDEKTFNGIVAGNKLYYDDGSNYLDLDNHLTLEGDYEDGPVTVKMYKRN